MATLAATHQFAPKPERFGTGSMGVAFLAHGFLIAALTWGTSWRSSNEITTASAELWAATPVQAAPALVEAPPPPEPVIEKPAEKAPEIVTQKTKVREKPEPPKKDLKADAAKKREREVERRDEQLRQEQMKRIAGLAGATGTPASTGTVQMSAGQKADYDAFIRSVVAPNINYQNTDFDRAALVTEVVFEIAADGSILRPRMFKSSGNKDWDAVAVRALEKTNIIPRDRKGFRPDSLIVQVKPRGQT